MAGAFQKSKAKKTRNRMSEKKGGEVCLVKKLLKVWKPAGRFQGKQPLLKCVKLNWQSNISVFLQCHKIGINFTDCRCPHLSPFSASWTFPASSYSHTLCCHVSAVQSYWSSPSKIPQLVGCVLPQDPVFQLGSYNENIHQDALLQSMEQFYTV